MTEIEKARHEENLKNWSKIRNLTKEECSRLGYSTGHRGLYVCKTCESEKYILNSHFKTRKTVCDNGCHGVGNNNKTITGLNDLATTHPHLVQYFVDKDLPKQISKGSEQKVRLKCPYCGYEKIMICYSFVSRGFSCPSCSDNFSFPEKFIFNLLRELEVDFKTQFKIDGFDYRYDFFIPQYNLIIETHGKQHYVKSFETAGGRTLEEEKENDRLKEYLAISKGYKYIVLDCQEGNTGYIKNSVLSSRLSSIIDLSKIDWLEIGRKSEESLIPDIAKYYNATKESTYKIADKFGVSTTTVSRYLKKAQELELCIFEPQNKKPIKVVMVDKDKVLRIEEGARKMGRELDYCYITISKLAKGQGSCGHFMNSKKLGYVGFYYLGSEEWKKEQHKYLI